MANCLKSKSLHCHDAVVSHSIHELYSFICMNDSAIQVNTQNRKLIKSGVSPLANQNRLKFLGKKFWYHFLMFRYSLPSLCDSAEACMRALLGDEVQFYKFLFDHYIFFTHLRTVLRFSRLVFQISVFHIRIFSSLFSCIQS